jgi:hypothetical protein
MFPEEAETRKRSEVDMAERITQEPWVGADYVMFGKRARRKQLVTRCDQN